MERTERVNDNCLIFVRLQILLAFCKGMKEVRDQYREVRIGETIIVTFNSDEHIEELRCLDWCERPVVVQEEIVSWLG